MQVQATSYYDVCIRGATTPNHGPATESYSEQLSHTDTKKKEEKIEAHFSHTCYATKNPSNIFQLTTIWNPHDASKMYTFWGGFM